jgi:hypothetical protein
MGFDIFDGVCMVVSGASPEEAFCHGAGGLIWIFIICVLGSFVGAVLKPSLA